MNVSISTPEPGPPVIDTDAITRFAEFLFRACAGYVAIRKIREKGLPGAKPLTSYVSNGTHLARTLCLDAVAALKDQRGLYVVPVTARERGNARAENLFQTAVIPADLDKGDIGAMRGHLERHLGKPSLVVASGGLTDEGQQKLHLYWKLTEAVAGDDLAVVERIRDFITDAVGADASFRRLTQPIRVPGSIHGKNGVLNIVRLLEDNPLEYHLADLAEHARAMPTLPGRSTMPLKIATDGPAGKHADVAWLLMHQVHEGGADGITRYDAVSAIIGHWIRQTRIGRVTIGDAWNRVASYNATMLAPPREDWLVQRDFDAILNRDRLANPEAWARVPAVADLGNTAQPDEALGSDDATDIPAPERSEDALAKTFGALHGQDWRHVGIWGAWYRWTGTLWVADEIGAVFDQVRHVCRQVASRAPTAEARKIASQKTMTAVVKIAATDPAIAMSASAWDTHHDLLNTPDVVIDLQTGELLPHARDLLITQVTSVGPGGACSRWRRFLAQVTGDDGEMQAYLARVCGYCLTGETSEQVFFFLHGAGANGKSVFLQTLARVLGSYAATAPLDAFMVSRQGAHPTDLAGLRGKRMVSVSETEPGRAWAESRIKTITGGDPIRARFMHRDFFEFTPTFKLLVAGNHRPQLTGVGEAMRRRLHLIPFDVTIPPEHRDKALADKLGAELGGILGWMLEGLADWRNGGLRPPEKVHAASETYFSDEDDVGQWIAECCRTGDTVRATAKSLFASWSSWATSAGLQAGSQKALGEALLQRGFSRARTGQGRFWIGLAPGAASTDARP